MSTVDFVSQRDETRPLEQPFYGVALVAFYFLVTGHLVYVSAVAASLFVVPFCAPWYIAAPCMAVPILILTSPGPCPLTWLENQLRCMLGKPKIRAFIGYYIWWPIKRALR